ncbi:MAG: hypothetical protein QM656_09510 [Paracoccaceae bacterium]
MIHQKPVSPQPVRQAPPCPPQADHDQGWQREKTRDDHDHTEQADGGKGGICP